MKASFSFIVGLLCSFVSYSQSPTFKNFKVDDGLPSNEVYYLMQDSKGYVWFSTDRGVSRYNGHEFESYTLNNGLVDNTVFFTHEDSLNRIWFVGFSSELCYSLNDRIHSYRWNDKISKLNIPKTPKASFNIRSNKLYVGTYQKGLYTIDNRGIVKHELDPKASAKIENKNGNILFYTTGYDIEEIETLDIFPGDLKVTAFGREFTHSYGSQPRGIHINVLVRSNDDTLISLTNAIYKLKNNKINKLAEFDKKIIQLYEDQNRNCWIGFGETGGVKMYSSEAFEKPPTMHLLNGKTVTSILQDDESSFWFSTISDGVYYTPSLSFINSFKEELPAANVGKIITDDGNTFIGFSDGTIWEKSDKQKFKKVVTPKTNYSSDNPHFDLNYDYLRKKFVVSTSTVGFRKSPDFPIVDYHGVGRITQLANDTVNGKTFMGTSILGLLELKNNEWVRVQKKKERSWVTSIHIDKSSTVWYSTIDSGLHKYSDDQIVNYAQHPILGKRINHIRSLNDGTLLLVNEQYNLIVWNKDTIVPIDLKSNTSPLLINAIEVDKQNNIWIASSQGLIMLSLTSDLNWESHYFDQSDGLLSNYISSLAIDDSNVWVGTTNGLCVLNKNKFEIPQTKPKLYFKQVQINGNDTLLSQHYALNHYQKNISFKMTNISFKNNKNITYEYLLDGFDKQWKKTKHNEVEYRALSPGDYTFNIKSSNQSGVSSNIQSLSFHIAKPVWARWWFITMVIIFVSSLLWVFIKKRESQIIEKTNIQNKLLSLESKALRAQINPHLIFNSLNTIHALFLNSDKKKGGQFLTNFSRLLRAILNHSREKEVVFRNEIKLVEKYLALEQTRFNNSFLFQITIDPRIDDKNTFIPPMLIQPYVENAIIHGLNQTKGKIDLEFVLKNDFILCKITDNGIGYNHTKMQSNENKEHTSVGMLISKERLELLNKKLHKKAEVIITDLSSLDNNEQGTMVEISIPILSLKLRA